MKTLEGRRFLTRGLLEISLNAAAPQLLLGFTEDSPQELELQPPIESLLPSIQLLGVLTGLEENGRQVTLLALAA